MKESVSHKEYPFSSNYFYINGHNLHYIDEGEGEKTIILVHGNPTWSFYYRNVIKYLRKHYRVIALDNMGCGLSDKPQEYTYILEKHIQNLQLLIQHLNLKKFSMMLHDWGGAIGIGYAVNNIQKIDKLVLLNTAAFRSKHIPLRISLCKTPILGEFIVRALNGFAYPATFMALEKKMGSDIKQLYIKPYDSWKNRVAVYNFVKDIPLNSSHRSYSLLQSIEEKLATIHTEKIPVMVLWGGKDFCFTKHFYDRWREFLPEAKYVFFENYGHYVIEEDFSQIAPYLDDFLVLNSNCE